MTPAAVPPEAVTREANRPGGASTLYRGGRIFCPANPSATALRVAGEVIDWVGEDADAPAASRVVDLDGDLLAPAFVDAHVHTTDTGITLLGLDVSGARSAAEVLDAVAARAATLPGDAVVLGHGWDETDWPDPTPPGPGELDRAADGRRVYLARACVHSAIVSSALLAQAPVGVPGWDASGWLRRDAHHAVRAIAMSSFPTTQRRAVQRAALHHAASLGIAAVHECGGPGISSEDDFTSVLSCSGDGLPEVYGYWGELGAAAKARELGAVGAGGDLFADGALGSQTAHLRRPYLDADGAGFGYVTAEQVRDHLLLCDKEGVAGGFHAIGDRAIATVLAGFGLAAAVLGVDRLREGRHRIEHLEILDKQLIAGLVSFGVVASVQPAFDRRWGGEHGMYARRLGVDRSLASNPVGALAGVGVTLAFGSDSPVTPLDPWGTVRAAMNHHNPAHRVSARAAFAAHTRGGWRAVHHDDEGALVPGAPATFALWRVDGVQAGLPRMLPESPDEPEPALPTCRRTVLRGRVIFDADGAPGAEPARPAVPVAAAPDPGSGGEVG